MKKLFGFLASSGKGSVLSQSSGASVKDSIMMALPVMLIIFLLGMGILLAILRMFWGLVFIIPSILIFLVGLRNIQAVPPYVGVVTLWGERKPIIKKEGWRFFAPYFPFFYDAVLVLVQKNDTDFHPKQVRSSDGAELEIRIAVTWTPDKSNGQNLIEYINTGAKDGVENMLDDIVEEACRQWAIRQTWQECQRNRDKLARLLVGRITKNKGRDLTFIINSLRLGNGDARIQSLGIVMNRFNVGEIELKGELAKAAERTAVETRQMEAEKTEIRNVRDRARELQELGLSAEDAIEVVQTERGKVKKEIREIKGLGRLGEGLGKGLSQGLGIFRGR